MTLQENVCINNIQHSYSADRNNIKYVHICLDTHVGMHLLDFYYSNFLYLLFYDICRRAQYSSHFVLEATAFLCTCKLSCLVHSSGNPVARFICVQCQCLNPGQKQVEDSKSSHFLQWELDQMFNLQTTSVIFQVNLKNYICFLQSSKRRSHIMRQWLKFRVLLIISSFLLHAV